MRFPTALTVAALGVASIAPATTSLAATATDPLPSWNDTAPKHAIVGFVDTVTRPGISGFVPPAERIAVFDNDGTLWAEWPVYFQLQFALDRVKALAPQHPEWSTKEPYRYVLSGDMKSFAASGAKSVMSVIETAHSGMTTDEFEKTVRDWLRTAKHPQTHQPYTAMIYKPMVELLAYLRANGFKTFIVSGGGAEFIRVFAESLYGIPPEQVVGTQGKLEYQVRDGKPVLVKLPEIQFIDDKEGKPIGIQTFIGRRPLAAFGNSDGDLEMLEWTTSGPGSRFGLIVHHDDDEREWAYDRRSRIGTLDKAWDEAKAKGWTVVSMKDDWATVFPWTVQSPAGDVR
jgi:phosphoglycolate phosphatase-like HAD superfamily hydrolase